MNKQILKSLISDLLISSIIFDHQSNNRITSIDEFFNLVGLDFCNISSIKNTSDLPQVLSKIYLKDGRLLEIWDKEIGKEYL